MLLPSSWPPTAPHTRRLILDRSQAGFHQDIVHLRSCTVRGQSDTLSLRILLDRNSVEVFINGGEQTMTTCIYTPPEAERITFAANGAARITVEQYSLAL